MTESREKTKENEDNPAIENHALSYQHLPMNSVFTFLAPHRALEPFLFMVSQWKTNEFWFRR